MPPASDGGTVPFTKVTESVVTPLVSMDFNVKVTPGSPTSLMMDPPDVTKISSATLTGQPGVSSGSASTVLPDTFNSCGKLMQPVAPLVTAIPSSKPLGPSPHLEERVPTSGLAPAPNRPLIFERPKRHVSQPMTYCSSPTTPRPLQETQALSKAPSLFSVGVVQGVDGGRKLS